MHTFPLRIYPDTRTRAISSCIDCNTYSLADCRNSPPVYHFTLSS
jgi:hypothetical protein